MLTINGISSILSRKNSIFGLSEPDKCLIAWYLYTYVHFKFQLSTILVSSQIGRLPPFLYVAWDTLIESYMMNFAEI